MGQEAEVADAHEAWGKHMEQKPAQELLDRQSQQALLVSVVGVRQRKVTWSPVNDRRRWLERATRWV